MHQTVILGALSVAPNVRTEFRYSPPLLLLLASSLPALAPSPSSSPRYAARKHAVSGLETPKARWLRRASGVTSARGPAGRLLSVTVASRLARAPQAHRCGSAPPYDSVSNARHSSITSTRRSALHFPARDVCLLSLASFWVQPRTSDQSWATHFVTIEWRESAPAYGPVVHRMETAWGHRRESRRRGRTRSFCFVRTTRLARRGQTANMLTRTSIALTLAAASAVAAPATAPSSASSAPTSSASSTAGTGILTADGFTNQKWLDAFHKAKEVVGGLSFDQKVRCLPRLVTLWPSSPSSSELTALTLLLVSAD